VYPKFAEFGSSLIPASNSAPVEGSLSEDECELIRSVWDAYKKFSAIKLREMTHNETPWKEAHKGYQPGERCEVKITKTAMKKYFSTLVTK
jgi:uncharacterized phage-associated protein